MSVASNPLQSTKGDHHVECSSPLGKRKRNYTTFASDNAITCQTDIENWGPVGVMRDEIRSREERLLLSRLPCFLMEPNVDSVCFYLKRWTMFDSSTPPVNEIVEFRGSSSATLHEFVRGIHQLYLYLKADQHMLILSIGYIQRLHARGCSLTSVTLYRPTCLHAAHHQILRRRQHSEQLLCAAGGAAAERRQCARAALLRALRRVVLSAEELVAVNRGLGVQHIAEL